jgi:hypothetical protein
VDDADRAELEFDVRLPAAIRSRVRSATTLKDKAEKAQEEAQNGLASAATDLTEKFGLSLRDAAELMGLSHQRIQQLVLARNRREAG